MAMGSFENCNGEGIRLREDGPRISYFPRMLARCLMNKVDIQKQLVMINQVIVVAKLGVAFKLIVARGATRMKAAQVGSSTALKRNWC